MAIFHIVLMQFKSAVQSAEVHDVCSRMLDLRNQCIHPQTKQPYIVKSSGGRDNSPEGHQDGLTHGFVVEFESDEDRKYYLEKDPAHLGFVKSLEGVIEKVTIVDYVPGVF